MPYRMVTHLGNLCGRLAGAAAEHKERIVSSLTERWRDQLEEGEELTVTKMLTLLGEDLQRIHVQLTHDENTLRSQLREDKQRRRMRDRSKSILRELLFDIKNLCEAHYGPGSAETLFEEDSEDVPTEASEVFRLAARVQRNMLDPEFPMPPLKHGIAADFSALAALLEKPLAELGMSLQGLHHGGQGSSGAVADKELHLDELQGLAGRSGRLLETITSFAGHEGVARRIRQSRHRARGGVEEPEEPEEPEAVEVDASEVDATEVDASGFAEGETAEEGPPEIEEISA